MVGFHLMATLRGQFSLERAIAGQPEECGGKVSGFVGDQDVVAMIYGKTFGSDRG